MGLSRLTVRGSQGVVHSWTGGVGGEAGRGSDPSEVCRGVILQATQGALEGALSLRWTGPIHTVRHHNVIDRNAAVGPSQNGLKNELTQMKLSMCAQVCVCACVQGKMCYIKSM